MKAQAGTPADRAQIRQLLAAIARGEDRRERALLEAAFWPDAVIDFGVFRGTFAEYLGWVVPGDPALPVTLHTLGQSYFQFRGEEARVETHVVSYHRVRTAAGDRDTAIGGRYLDRFARRRGEWRLAERTLLYDWYRDFGPAADWAAGVMGHPLPPDYVGRGAEDASRAFFAIGEGD